MKKGIALTVLVLVAPVLFAAIGDAPDVVVNRFYTAYLHAKSPGLPSESQMKALAPHLSARLQESIRAARVYQKQYEREHPGDKPPFADGDLFSSLFEGPTSFEVEPGEETPEGSKIVVRFSYQDPAKPSEVFRWQDAVIVRKEGKRYVVDDVLYLGDWEFKNSGRLSDVLKSRD